MPTYEYECGDCGHSLEKWQSMVDKKLRKCPSCGKLKLHRLIGTGGGIIFKGSGFYETDFKTKKEPPKTEKKTESTPKADKSTAKTATAKE